METATPVTFRCEFCDRDFRRESSLEVHMCEPKRRWRERDERGVELGLQAYLRFYEIQQGSSRLRGWDDFVVSQYYRAFVKFGRHCVSIRAVNPAQFLDWLLRNNRKIDHWCRDNMYEEYLAWWLPREAAADALERGMREIVDYVEGTPDLRMVWPITFDLPAPIECVSIFPQAESVPGSCITATAVWNSWTTCRRSTGP